MVTNQQVVDFLNNLDWIDRHNHIEVLELLNKLNIVLPPRAIGELFHCIEQGREVGRFIPMILEHGIYMEDLWHIPGALAEWIIPRLELFKKNLISYPPDLTPEEWEEIIDKILESHRIIAADDIGVELKREKELEEGLKLFSEYYLHLWD